MLFSFFPLRNHQRIWVKLQKPTRIIHISCRPLTFENITLIFSACHLASSSAGISTQWGRVYSLIFLGRCPEHHPSLIFVMVSNGCMNRVLWEVPANQLRKHLQIESPQGNLTAHHFQKKKVSFLDFFFSIFWGVMRCFRCFGWKDTPQTEKKQQPDCRLQTAEWLRIPAPIFATIAWSQKGGMWITVRVAPLVEPNKNKYFFRINLRQWKTNH